MPKRLTRVESQALTQARLLEAAATVFARRGFEGASVDDIVEEAGLSKGAMYANFASKEALFLALLDRCLDQVEQALREVFAHEHTLAARIDAASRLTPAIVGQARDWRLLATEFSLHAARHPDLQEELAARYRAQTAAIARLFTQAYHDLGRPPPAPPKDLALAVVALEHGLSLRAAIDPTAVPAGLFATALALLLDGPGVDHEKEKQ